VFLLNKKVFIVLAFVLLAPVWFYSQTILTGNLYIVNKYPVNPAYTGEQNYLIAFINYRNATASIEGSPTLISFGANLPIYKKMSLGTRFYKQSEGLFDILSGFADYSYWIEIAEEHKMRFGISAGLKSSQIDYSDIMADNPSAIIDVASRNFEGVSFQGSAGIVYEWRNFEWSISVPQLFEQKNSFKLAYQSLISYQTKFKNQDISLKPSIFFSFRSNTPFLFDINMQAYWKNQYWLGIGYRNRPGIIASAGFKIKQMNLAYSLEIGAEKFSNMFKQIHEISVNYSFQKKKKTPNNIIVVPDDHFITQNDTSQLVTVVQNGEVKKIVADINSSLKADSTKSNEYKSSKFKIIDAGEGIYVIKSSTNDTVNFVADEEYMDFEEDSLFFKNIVNQIDNKENNGFYIIDEGDGIFSIKSNRNSDKSSNLYEINDKIIDSLLKSNNWINDMDSISENESSDNSILNSEFYTIQLFINSQNNYLLSNPDIIDEARFENKDGHFEYFYGHFNSKEEAMKIGQKFNKYKDLEVIIIRLEVMP